MPLSIKNKTFVKNRGRKLIPWYHLDSVAWTALKSSANGLSREGLISFDFFFRRSPATSVYGYRGLLSNRPSLSAPVNLLLRVIYSTSNLLEKSRLYKTSEGSYSCHPQNGSWQTRLNYIAADSLNNRSPSLRHFDSRKPFLPESQMQIGSKKLGSYREPS